MMGAVYTPTDYDDDGMGLLFFFVFFFQELSVGLETVFSLESSYISRTDHSKISFWTYGTAVNDGLI